MDFYREPPLKAERLGVLAGSFNPPTVAHVELARAAIRCVDLVLCVIPRVFPHKEYHGATLEQRIEMLDAAGLGIPYAIAVTSEGLFIDIARECREHFGGETQLAFVCGRDAAERILYWDYGRPGVVEQMLSQFELLVAPRGGHFEAPAEYAGRVHSLDIASGHELVSSTEVRERIARGEPWRDLVPETIRPRVAEIYS